MPHPTSRRAAAPAAAMFLGLWLWPLVAAAEPADPGDVGHAIIVVGMLSMVFLSCLSFGIWLLVARLRADAAARRAATPPQLNLEGLWFPNNAKVPPGPDR